MKKMILAALSVLFFVACANNTGGGNQVQAQNSARESLKAEVNLVNSQLANQKIDYMTTMLSCELNGNDIIYKYSIDESYLTMDELESTRKATMKSNIEDTWRNNPQMTITKSNLNAIGGKVYYKYYGNRSGKTMVIVINP